ncbi:hypothetical protein V2J09_013076 [Rumex salicifolius]
MKDERLSTHEDRMSHIREKVTNKAPEVLNKIGTSLVIVGAANLDSTRISFFGSTKGKLAQKLDRGQDGVGRRRLTQVPLEPREMIAYYTTH